MRKIMLIIFVFNFILNAEENIEGESKVEKITQGNTSYSFKTEIYRPMKQLAKNSFWGGGAGLLLGLGMKLVSNRKDNKWLEIPTSIGLFTGAIYGSYSLVNRDDLYFKVTGEGDEKLKNEKVNIAIQKKLESPIKNLFYDSMWGGVFGFLMSGAVDLLSDNTSGYYDQGIGGGLLLGFTSSLIYSYIQKKRIKSLTHQVYSFINPANTLLMVD